MTNEHVISEEDLSKIEQLKILFDDSKKEKTINMTSERKKYHEKKFDITIIEILPEEDNIFHFLEIDISNINVNESIYILQYPAQKCSLSYGTIKKIDNYNIYNDCSTESGSSGGPILLLKNHKVIGIHKAFWDVDEINVGTLLKQPIGIFNSIPPNKKSKNNYVNSILCTYNITNEEEFNLLHDFKENIKGLDLELNKLYKEGKKKRNF